MREYVDLWPSWLDIEDRLYRPAIGGLLELGGRFAGLGSETTLETYVYRPMIRALTLFFAAVFGFLGGLTDFVADLHRPQGALRSEGRSPKTASATPMTRAVGGVFDGMAEGLNHTVLRGHRIEHHAMARISAVWDGVDGRRQPDEPHDELRPAALRAGAVRDAAVSDVLLRICQKSAAFPFTRESGAFCVETD